MAAPNFWTSTRGTKINTAGLQGNQLQKIQNLANSGYGTKAAQMASTLQARIPKAGAPLQPINAAQPGRVAPPMGVPNNNISISPMEGGPQPLSPQQNAWIPENKPLVPATTGGGLPPDGIQTVGTMAPKVPKANNFFTSTLGTKINVAGITGNQLQKIQQLANSGYGTKAAQMAKTLQSRIPKTVAPVAPAVAPSAVPAQGQLPNETGDIGAGTTTMPPATPPGGDSGTADGLFPTAQMFEKGFAGDPLYDFQVKEGLNQVDKSLAARGLTNSGAGIRAELDVPAQASALAANRMQQLATDNANRLYNVQQNEANRLYNTGNDQWNHALSLAQLMASQSPYDSALAGLNNTASLTKEQSKAQANYLAQAYKKVFGGGGGGAAPVPIPVPGGPDYSNIIPTQIAGNTSSNNGWLNLGTNLLAGLFPAAKAGA